MIKKSLVLILTLCCFVISSSAQTLTFRGIPLEASSKEVIIKLGNPSSQTTKAETSHILGDLLLVYNNLNVAGYTADAQLEFKEDSLIGAGYSFSFEQPIDILGARDPRKYINAYNDLINKLKGLYGQPVTINEISSIEGSYSSLLAYELAREAPYRATWKVGNSGIWLILDNDEKKGWSMNLMYLSPYLMTLIQKQQNSLEGLN